MARNFGQVAVAAAMAFLLPGVAFAASPAPDLRKPAGAEWLHVGGDWSNSRYSTLTQLTRANVKNLKAAWVTHLGSGLPQLAQ